MLAALLLTLLQASPADATEPEILVEGQAKTDSEIRDEAHGFIRAIAAAPGSSDQLGRWNHPICVKVLGGTPTEESLVLERIAGLASEAGIRQAKQKNCAPNILVAFTADPAGVTKEVLARRPHSARGLPVSARKDLVDGTYPVRWWYDFKVEARSGLAPVGDSPVLLGALVTQAGGPGAGGGGQIAQSENQSGNFSDYSSSLIGTKTRLSLGGAIVVVDVAAVRARPKESLASFIAFVALAPLKLPPKPVTTPTITNLFSKSADAHTLDLSEWDRAYVAALYKVGADRTAKVQQGAITARIARVLRGEEKQP